MIMHYLWLDLISFIVLSIILPLNQVIPVKKNHADGYINQDTVLFIVKLHHTYYTKARLARIYDGVNPTCDRCEQSPANLIQMLWHCPSLSELVGEKIKEI